MIVAYHHSIDDLVELHMAQLRWQRTRGRAAKVHTTTLILASVLCAIGGLLWLVTKQPPYFLFVFILIYALLQIFTSESSTKRRYRKAITRALPGQDWSPSMIELRKTGIAHINATACIEFWWFAVKEIRLEGDYLRVYAEDNYVSQIPLRVFRTPADQERFKTALSQHWQANRDRCPVSFPGESGLIQDRPIVDVNPNPPAPPSESP
ncbi:MAG: hypothetical protein ACPGYV_08260 [Phycisphaeraceae bacterium]